MNNDLIVDFDAMADHLRVDYAGYGDKAARRDEELRVWTAAMRSEAMSAVARAVGTSSLRSWLGFFQDHHLTLVDTQARDSIRCAPERIGILMDNRCASAAEEFLLLARQSRKVVLFGSNSRGCLDYSNVRKIPLPSGSRVLGVPMSRSRRLPQSPVDGHGIAPDVRLAEGERDPVGFVLGCLETAVG
jgi:hypothetical protein